MRHLLLIVLAGLMAFSFPATARAEGFVLEPPVPGAVVKGLGEFSRYSAGHRGVDLAAQPGDPVRAGAVGKVHFVGSVAGVSVVSLEHGNGLRTSYLPVKPSVSKGQLVQAGQQLGTLLSGHCPAGCLHWGLTDGQDYFDPLSYLRTRQVRLLPDGTKPTLPPRFPPAQAGAAKAPVAGRISSPFGMRVHPVTGVYKLHDGLDFAAPCGAPIHTPWAGTVVSASWDGAYGLRVMIRHSDRSSAYAHLSSASVRPGQSLAAGELLGHVGTTGSSTGCHLHWMGWVKGRLVDPTGWLAADS